MFFFHFFPWFLWVFRLVSRDPRVVCFSLKAFRHPSGLISTSQNVLKCLKWEEDLCPIVTAGREKPKHATYHIYVMYYALFASCRVGETSPLSPPNVLCLLPVGSEILREHDVAETLRRRECSEQNNNDI